ncbi:MAG TPA: AAA family ATPase, partial [Thermomicrobiales bacterium]|nr:AAA family ATPase [Thermomicrobiales bacterium]
MDRVSPGSHSGLVGRDRELAILNGCLTAAQGGRGSLVLISGEAGIGKTALTNSFTHAATNARLTVLTGHCYDRTETPPYGPWREIGQRVDAIPVPRIDDATSQADLFTQARDFLAAMTAERPLVLVLEDLHWADNASLDLLRFLARGFGDLPLLCVATYRDDEVERHHPLAGLVPLLVREAPTERLSLRPLNTSAAQALVRARYDFAEPASERLAMYLIERTEGNALFMTELLRSLEEDRLLERVVSDPHAWSLAPTPVPSLLQQIVDDRL